MSLGKLFRDHYDAVRRFFLVQLGDARLAEELAQETFYQACHAVDGYRGDSSMRAWVFGIARNVLRRHFRSRGRSRELLQEPWDLERLQRAGAPADQPQEQLLAAESSRQLWHALDSLPERYRTALWLRDVHEVDYREMTEIMNCSEGAVRMLVHRARKALRRAHRQLTDKPVDNGQNESGRSDDDDTPQKGR